MVAMNGPASFTIDLSYEPAFTFTPLTKVRVMFKLTFPSAPNNPMLPSRILDLYQVSWVGPTSYGPTTTFINLVSPYVFATNHDGADGTATLAKS